MNLAFPADNAIDSNSETLCRPANTLEHVRIGHELLLAGEPSSDGALEPTESLSAHNPRTLGSRVGRSALYDWRRSKVMLSWAANPSVSILLRGGYDNTTTTTL